MKHHSEVETDTLIRKPEQANRWNVEYLCFRDYQNSITNALHRPLGLSELPTGSTAREAIAIAWVKT